MAAVTVKGSPASAAQVANITLCCQIGQQMGANAEQLAGAIATMMQESACVNLTGGDRDSAGLFQQRPSVGAWGSYADVTNPSHAIRAFMTPYLNYCQQGHSVLDASNLVQRSAYPSAPAQWLPESRRDVQLVTGSADFTDATAPGLSMSQSTRAQPYQFSRGSAGQKETSWDCMGRLAQEVNWERFMRAGVLWFASDNWLGKQTPRFLFAENARGVLQITFDADSRSQAAEATVTALAKRWSVLPGDVARVTGQGPGDGLWLVSDTRRTLWDANTEITLKRPQAAAPEPAPETTTSTITVGGVNTSRAFPSAIGSGGAVAGPDQARALYNACQTMSDMNLPYSQSDRTLVAHPPSADCSSSVSWALLAAGFPLPGGVHAGQWAPVSGQFMSGWGQSGRGRWFTVWCSSEHIWIQFTGVGPAWRFDTSPWSCGTDGPRMRTCPRSTATFTARCWPGL